VIFIVDTHALVWFFGNAARLSKDARVALTEPDSRLVVPTIVLAELKFLFAKGRTPSNYAELLKESTNSLNVIIHPFDQMVVDRFPTTLDIHDAIIVGTALVYRDDMHEKSAIITKDRAITGSKLIETIW
jgi:PIN domain nuclease of toxin-antitoxin system